MKYVFLASAVLTQIASAHPGPPGHHHPENGDWPFDDVVWGAAFVAGLAALFLIRKFVRKGY